MYARDVVHVAACGRKAIGCGLRHPLARPACIAGRFEVQADVEMREKLRRRFRASRGRHLRLGERPREHPIDFRHRPARIRPHRQQRGARRLERLGSGDTQEVPGGVLHIIGIHRAVLLELTTAVLVAPGIIERDTALPEVGCG